MTPKRRTFEAEIEAGRGGGAFVVVPFDVESAYGARGRVKVKATFDGQPCRGSIAPMGGRHLLGIVRSIREELGKSIGDRVAVTLELDTEERTVQVPPELAEVLQASPAAAEFYGGLSYTCRREYAQWIAAGKRPETRLRRAAKAIDKLGRGEKL